MSGEAFAVDSLWTTFFMRLQPIQTWSDFYLWERFLTEHIEARSIIEIGTGGGGASIFLLMQAIDRGMSFDTFDQFEAPAWKLSPLCSMLGLQDHFHVGDVWGASGDVIRQIIADPARHPLVLFCDGGNKPREYREFGALLLPGDLIVVHDWMNEFGPLDMKPVAVDEWRVSECAALKSMTRFMVKK